jgi:hypothetical protein
MITAEEIRKKSENIYVEFLKSVVLEESFFPKVIRSNKSVSSDFSEMRNELVKVIKHSKDKKGFGYTITYKQINTRKHGIQSLPEEISFQTETDFLKYLHKEKEVAEFRQNYTFILSKFPQLKEWIIKYPQNVIENHSQWNDLLKVCDYFIETPKPNLYIRELPIKIHTKFIENNKGIIRELLDIVISEHINLIETNFEKRFNLKYAEPTVRFRILDTGISQTYFSGIDDLSIPVSQFEQLNLPLNNVLVVENKTNLHTIALTLPKFAKTIVVFGSGYKVENLKNTNWLNHVELFYWGDLDVQGFEILSQFRGYFPHTKSFLMDKKTFDKFFENDKGTPSKVTGNLNLSDEENELYKLLKENNWRLEQEKIPFEYVNEFVIYWILRTMSLAESKESIKA